MVWQWIVMGSGLLACVGCAPVISSETRNLVDSDLSYGQIVANPLAYTGQLVLLAGRIIEAKNLPQGTQLEILQFPANRQGRPKTQAASQGRFLIVAPEYLETAVYRPGRSITVAGEVTGVRDQPVGGTTYRYPVIVPRELHLWKQGHGSPQLHIGFGFGFSKSF